MKQNSRYFIGLTGGIGSGKSTAAEILSELGAYIIDADVIARSITLPGSFGAREIEREFGSSFFDDGVLNRRRLREFVFSSKKDTDRLNAITHGLIREELCDQMERSEAAVTVCVVPLLFEAGWEELFDEVWLICAFRETRINRAAVRDNIERDNILSVINAQMSDSYKKRLTNIVINNNGTIKKLRNDLTAQYNRVINLSHE